MDSFNRRIESTGRDNRKNTADILCRVKFTNNLPDIPFDPKFIKYSFDNSRFVDYKQTSLEKSHKWDIQNDVELEVAVDLINRQLYAVGNEPAILHPDDERLLEDEPTNKNNVLRAELNARIVPWLRKTEYIGSNSQINATKEANSDHISSSKIKRRVEEAQNFPSREEQIETIENSFAVAQEQIENHYSKPHVHKVAEWYVFPDEKIWPYPCSQVIFDDDPTPPNQLTDSPNIISEALIRAITDQNDDQFMGYFLPDESSFQKLEQRTPTTEDEEYQFRMTKEYNWSVKNVSAQEGEENYFFIFNQDQVLYSPLDTRVRLNKRRNKKNKIMDAEMSVQYRPLSEREMIRQDRRMMGLSSYVDDRYDLSDEEESADEQATENIEKINIPSENESDAIPNDEI